MQYMIKAEDGQICFVEYFVSEQNDLTFVLLLMVELIDISLIIL